jgi:hypothetical protein
MSNCLKIGSRQFSGDQVVTALVRYRMLDTLVSNVVLDQEVQSLPLSQQEVFNQLMGATDTPVPDNFDQFLVDWCAQRGMSEDYLHSVILRELRVEKFKQLQFGTQVESEFLRTKSELDQVEFFLLELNSLSLAQEIYYQLRDDDQEFMQLAAQCTADQQQMAGRVGPVAFSQLPIAVAEAFRNGAVGNIYGPIPVADRFWVMRIEQFIAARLTDVTRSQIMNRLYNQWLQSQVEAITAQPGAIALQLSGS